MKRLWLGGLRIEIMVTEGLSRRCKRAERSGKEHFGCLLFMDDFKKAFILSTIRLPIRLSRILALSQYLPSFYGRNQRTTPKNSCTLGNILLSCNIHIDFFFCQVHFVVYPSCRWYSPIH
jgi:hypothetical protein